MKILMVCLGNICRSPLAEGLLKSKIDPTKASVDSAGTGNFHVDEAPDPRMIKTARKYGVDISSLRGRQFEPADFDRFDRIYVMDEGNYDKVIAQARTAADESKVDLLLNQLEPGSNLPVPDPYFGGDQGFEEVYNLVAKATDQIAQKIEHGTL